MSIAHKVSAYNRQRKWQIFLENLPVTPQAKVLDVGFSEGEYSPVDNFIEKNYPYPEMLTALGVDAPCQFTQRYPKVRAVQYPGDRFPFEDQEFDICWSNAVLEHVGGQEKQVAFLTEIKRVARTAFITTPNKWFPVELHTRAPLLHYLPKPVFDAYLRTIRKSWAAGDYMHLLSLNDLRNLLKQAHIEPRRLIRNKIAGLTLDFAVIF
jgi:SAM-dependent methyltransferase